MYKPHFAFKHYPFDNTLRSDELFDSDATREARTRIRHLLDLRGIKPAFSTAISMWIWR